MRGGRLWLKIEAFGGTIRVYIVKRPLLDPDDGVTELDGLYERDKGTIKVAWADDVDVMKHSLWHEVAGHVMLREDHTLSSAQEEKLVRAIDHVQFDLLVRNGWLKIPNPPKLR